MGDEKRKQEMERERERERKGIECKLSGSPRNDQFISYASREPAMDKVAVPMIDHARMAAAIVDNIVKRFESSSFPKRSSVTVSFSRPFEL